MPPAGKAEAALRKQKDARQKKMLIMLAPVFLGLVAWQGPGILKAFSGSEPTPAPAAAPASTTSSWHRNSRCALPRPAFGALPDAPDRQSILLARPRSAVGPATQNRSHVEQFAPPVTCGVCGR